MRNDLAHVSVERTRGIILLIKEQFCTPVDGLGFQPLIIPGKPVCLVQKPLCFATSAINGALSS
jgi:hypothetical protein